MLVLTICKHSFFTFVVCLICSAKGLVQTESRTVSAVRGAFYAVRAVNGPKQREQTQLFGFEKELGQHPLTHQESFGPTTLSLRTEAFLEHI